MLFSRFALWCIGMLLLAGLSWLTLYALRDDWLLWRTATCWPKECFCEAIRPSTIRQPSNAWSSLAFAGAALLIGLDRSRTENLLGREPVLRWLLIISLLIIGVGSLFYHASLTFIGQWWDVLGMYLLATWMLLYTAARTWPRHAWLWALLFCLGNVVLAAELILIPEVRRYAFAVLLTSAIVWEWWYARRPTVRLETRYFKRGLLLFIFGSVWWIGDVSGWLCAPNSLLQGHAIWHMLGAAASYQLYVYYRSEQATLRL